MRVIIDATGEHVPDLHRMQVDDHSVLVDLDGIRKSIVDPTSLTSPDIARIEWGPGVGHTDATRREGGMIYFTDGRRPQPFFDRHLLTPYLAKFEEAKAAALAPEEEA